MTLIQSEAVSAFRDHYKSIFKQLDRGPVLLVQNSKVAAVLVSPEQWNAQQAELQRLRLLNAAKRVLAEIHSGQTETTAHDELKQQILDQRSQKDRRSVATGI